MKIIRGLSLTRPWPFAFDNGPAPKRVENRSWKPYPFMVGNYIALHAAQSWDEDDREFIADMTGLYVPSNAESPHSQIFAVCRLTGHVEQIEKLHPEQRRWFFGPFGWTVDDYVQLVEPVSCVGARGLWGFEKRQAELQNLREVYAHSHKNTPDLVTAKTVDSPAPTQEKQA